MIGRPEAAEIAAVVRAAIAHGLLAPTEPAVVFHDLDRLRARFQGLQQAFPPGTLHAVAIKANPLVKLLRFLVQLGAGLEAASLEEVSLALAAGCPPDQIVYDSPAKSVPDLAFALERGVRINADNLDELARIAALRGDSPSCIGVRVNPLVGAGTIQATSVTGATSQFGLMLEQPTQGQLVEAFRRYPWLTALHVHVGSQGCTLEQLVEGVRRTVAFREEVHAALGRPQIEVLDVGGGLPVAYREADQPPDAAAYAAALDGMLPAGVQLVTELGRYLHANCGWAASRVEYVKQQGGRTTATLHLGADFLLRRAYRPQDWHHDFLVLDAHGEPKQGDLVPQTLAGPLCFAGDIMARDLPLPPIAPGDLVVFRDVGAYAIGMWSRHCSRGLPEVVGYTAGPQFQTLFRRERPADVVAFWEGDR